MTGFKPETFVNARTLVGLLLARDKDELATMWPSLPELTEQEFDAVVECAEKLWEHLIGYAVGLSERDVK